MSADEVYGILSTAQANQAGQYLYGVYGLAGDAQSTLSAGIYGASINSPNNWAGYFLGRGLIANGPWQPSDESLKTGIEECQSTLAMLGELEVYSYTFNDEVIGRMGAPEGLQYGVMAQQLEEVFPQFVTNAMMPPVRDSLGNILEEAVEFKAVNYTGLIPVMMQGMKEQQTQIESLNARLEEMEAALAEVGIRKSMDSGSSTLRADYELYQNRPNPFSESTEIIWRMAEEAQARIIVQDEQGRTVATLQDGTSGKGLHSIEWHAADLPAGTYFYSLEVDGQLMVKRAVKLER